MSKKSMSPEEKAALLILSLGDDLGAQIFSKLERQEAVKIAGQLKKLGRTDQAQIDDVLKEFLGLLQKPAGPAQSDPAAFAARLVKASLKDQASEKLLENIARGHVRMRVFDMVDVEGLARVVMNEQPQTIALVLAHAPAPMGGALVKLLPERLRTDLFLRIAHLQAVDPEILHELDDHLIKEAGRTAPKHKVGGVRKVAELLNHMDKDGARILEDLEARNKPLAESVREEMFTFDDLIQVNGRGIQEILKTAKRETLLLALRGAPPALFDLFLKNMSERSGQLFKDDFEASGAQKAADVRAARQSVLALLKKLMEEGKVALDKGEKMVS